MLLRFTIGCLVSCLVLFANRSIVAENHLPESKRIIFLGDSITHAGGYIAAIDTAIYLQHPENHLELINLGLPSETVSGLTEPGHAGGAFPRPDLHERLQRVLEQSKPDLVVACYGMNDGIYYPFSEDRFGNFKDGIERLHIDVEKSGAKIIHLTPAFFDALPIKDRLLPAGEKEYRQPYAGYDDVLEAYSAWLLKKKQAGWEVLDVHGAMKQSVLEKRKTNPSFTFAGDGVHPNLEGQLVVASPLAAYWGLKLDAPSPEMINEVDEIKALVEKKQQLLKLAWLSSTKHTRPGIPQGLPVADAEIKALELDKEIRELRKK